MENEGTKTKGTERKTKQGFTLVEVMTVLVILAMLAVMAVPSLENLFKRSQQTARDNTARTLFMAAQSALTNKYAQDTRYADTLQGLAGAGVGGAMEQITLSSLKNPSYTAEMGLNNQGKDYAFKKDRGDESSALYTLLNPYMNDKSVFNGTIVIEFNIETGNVLSAFYSDSPQVTTMGYGSGADITDRDYDARFKQKIGYYGVLTTGQVTSPGRLDEVSVHLADYDFDSTVESTKYPAYQDTTVDTLALGTAPYQNHCYGLLTAECGLPYTTTELANKGLTCELTLEPQAGGAETITVSWNPANGAADYQGTALPDSITQAMSTTDIMTDARGRHIPAFISSAAGKTYLIVVLDSVTEPFTLEKNFSQIKSGFLTATLTLTDGASETSAFSNTRHAFFAGKEDGAATETLLVTSVRHLKNIRRDASAWYTQQQDIPVHNFKGENADFQPIGSADKPFTGSYNGNGKTIFDLVMAGKSRAALFDTLEKKDASQPGLVKKVYLDQSCSFSAASEGEDARAAAIACLNKGSIQNCESRANIITSTAGGVAGGIAAENGMGGSIATSSVNANVMGHKYAGGIAGINNGAINYCEVGTLSKGNEVSHLFRGHPFFGAIGASKAAYATPDGTVETQGYYFDNDVFFVKALQSGSSAKAGAGGIAAIMDHSDASVGYCTNAAKINYSSENGAAAPWYGGGIVGDAENGIVAYCYNTGTVFGAGPTGGIVGQLNSSLRHSYNVARVNAEQESFSDNAVKLGVRLNSRRMYLMKKSDNVGEDTDGSACHPFGGIVGFGGNTAYITDCYSAHYVGAKYGGAFGVLHRDASFDGCHYQKNYFNKSAQYYVTNSTDPSTGSLVDPGDVRAYFNQSSAYMRQKTGWDSVNVSSFSNVTVGENRAVGVQNYRLPYLDFSAESNAASALGDSFHRTPWDRPVEELGYIKIGEKSGSTTGELVLTVKLLYGYGDIWLTTDTGERIRIELHDTTLRQMETVHSEGAAVSFSGNTGSSQAGGDGRSYKGYTELVAADSDDDLLGYQYVYKIFLRWDKQTGKYDYLSDGNNPAVVTARLYEHGYTDENHLYDTSTLTRGNKVRFATYLWNLYSTKFLYIGLDNPNHLPMTVKVIYTKSSKAPFTFTIPGNSFISPYPYYVTTFLGNGAYNHPEDWVAGSDGSTKLYPFFKEGLDFTGDNGYYLALFNTRKSSSYPLPKSKSGKNGFEPNEPFRIQVIFDGNTYTTPTTAEYAPGN